MAKFADTPAWKRRQKWDPDAGRMLSPPAPPTRKQASLLRNLCREAGSEYTPPVSRREAQSVISKLLADKRRAGR